MWSERDFQRWLIDQWHELGFWAENIHPGFGGTTGIPDTLVKRDIMASHEDALVPIELKKAHVVERGSELVFKLDRPVRASQIRWAKEFKASHGRSGLVVVYWCDPWRYFWVPRVLWLDGQTSWNRRQAVQCKDPNHIIDLVLSGN